MQAQVQIPAGVTFKGFAEKSNARRALRKSFGLDTPTADALLRQVNEQWGFLLADGATLYTEPVDEADPMLTPATLLPASIAQAEAEERVNAPAMTTDDAPKYDDLEEADDSPTISGAFAAMANPIAPPQAPAGTVVRDGKKVDPNAPAPEATDKAVNPGDPCPLCGGDHTEQHSANEGVSASCGVCKQTYSAKSGRPIAHAGHTRVGVNKGYTIEKNRVTQNGKTMRSPGTICGNIWLAFDNFAKANGGMVVAGDLDAIATAGGWNRNNASCEFYAWRKFRGIKGRQVRTVVEAK